MRTHTHRCFVFPSPVRRVFLTGVRDRAPAQIEIQRFLNCNCKLNQLLPNTSTCTVTGAIADVGDMSAALTRAESAARFDSCVCVARAARVLCKSASHPKVGSGCALY